MFLILNSFSALSYQEQELAKCLNFKASRMVFPLFSNNQQHLTPSHSLRQCFLNERVITANETLFGNTNQSLYNPILGVILHWHCNPHLLRESTSISRTHNKLLLLHLLLLLLLIPTEMFSSSSKRVTLP